MPLDDVVDYKNIGLAKLLYELRQHLDVYCLIGANASAINALRVGQSFFGHVQQTELQAISLTICKIYEDEKRFPLNSVPGVCRLLVHGGPANEEGLVRAFLDKHRCPCDRPSPAAINAVVERFLKERSEDLVRFKEFRDKKVAHSEYAIEIDALPSYAAMERFFEFGAEFYALVAEAFVGVGAADLHRTVKVSLGNVLEALGLRTMRTEIS